MVRRGRTHLLEERAPFLQRADIGAVVAHLAPAERAEPADLVLPRRVPDVDREVGPERRPHVARPSRRADHLVPLERVGRGVRRAEHLDPEPLEQRARPELRLRELLLHPVVDAHGGRAVEPLGDPEHAFELVREPGAARRAAKQVEVVREHLPDLPRIRFRRRPIQPRDPEALHRHALRVQHPHEVVIRHDDQRRRVWKRRVLGEHPRVDMPVRAHQREIRDTVIQSRARSRERRARGRSSDWGSAWGTHQMHDAECTMHTLRAAKTARCETVATRDDVA